MSKFIPQVRVIIFIGVVLAVAGLSLASGSWVGTASAQTVPTPVPTTPPQPPQPPAPTPVGGKALGKSGGSYACTSPWTLTVPANVAPDGSTAHCGSFNPAASLYRPAEYKFLAHMINIHIYNEWGGWLTTFNPKLTVCYLYTAADVTAAGGQAANLTILTSPAPPYATRWTALATTVSATKQQVCAQTDHLTLFDVGVCASGNCQPTTAAASTYTVRGGDTLFRIARRYNLTVAALKAANGLVANLIYPGQVLKIPGGGTVPAATPAPVTPAPCTGGTRTYTVQAGDNLFRIALKHNVTLSALRTANNIWGDWIYVGQVLIIPGTCK